VTYQVLTNAELPETLLNALDGKCTINCWSESETDPNLLDKAEGFLVYGHPHIGGEIMDTMPNLRVISNFGVGVDHIDLVAARERNIPVGNTPGLVDGVTADLTFALLMAIARNFLQGVRYAHGPDFTLYDPNILHGHEVYGSTLGIIGMGNIGRVVARRASGFEMPTLYHNRKRNLEAEAELGVTYATLPELLQQADFVTLNVPLTPETRHIIGQEELQMMKPTAYLINVARGGVVDHDAIVEALQVGEIAGYATDVTEPEPLPRDHPLLTMDNVIILPHLGSATVQTRLRMIQRMADNLMAGLQSKPLLNQAN